MKHARVYRFLGIVYNMIKKYDCHNMSILEWIFTGYVSEDYKYRNILS